MIGCVNKCWGLYTQAIYMVIMEAIYCSQSFYCYFNLKNWEPKPPIS